GARRPSASPTRSSSGRTPARSPDAGAGPPMLARSIFVRYPARVTDADVSRANPRVTLAVLSLAGLAYAVLSSSVVPALTTIQHDLHATENGVAWILTGFLLSASVGTAILGRLGDMYGKERVLMWTLVTFAAGTLR